MRTKLDLKVAFYPNQWFWAGFIWMSVVLDNQNWSRIRIVRLLLLRQKYSLAMLRTIRALMA